VTTSWDHELVLDEHVATQLRTSMMIVFPSGVSMMVCSAGIFAGVSFGSKSGDGSSGSFSCMTTGDGSISGGFLRKKNTPDKRSAAIKAYKRIASRFKIRFSFGGIKK